MSYPLLASEDHKILGAEYCSGYTDVFGKWNTGFYCPQTPSNTAGFCCGTSFVKYCCTTKAQSVIDGGQVHYIFHQIPVLVGICCGVLAVVMSIIVASCYFCSCCVVYKKRRAHHPGGLYRLQGSSSTVSGLGNIYSTISHQANSLVTTPLGLDTDWHQQMLTVPPQLSTGTNSTPIIPQNLNNFTNSSRLPANQFNTLNLYSSYMTPTAGGGNVYPARPIDYNPSFHNNQLSNGFSLARNVSSSSNQNRNCHPSLCTMSRQNQIQNLSQAILQARSQSQQAPAGNYRCENSYNNGLRPQYLTQLRVNPRARIPVPNNHSQSNIRTNNKPVFYQNQSQALAVQSNRHHYHQTLANSIIMRANQYQRVLNGSMTRSMSQSSSNPNHNQEGSRENAAIGSSLQTETAQPINTNTLTSSSPSAATLAVVESALTNTNGVAECATEKTMANINIDCEPINSDPSNEITNGPPTTILSPSASTSLTSELHPRSSSADDTLRKMSSDPATESVEISDGCPIELTRTQEMLLVYVGGNKGDIVKEGATAEIQM